MRAAIPLPALSSSVRAALRPIAPELSTSEFRTIQDLVDKAICPRRFVVVLLGGFPAFALILAALGIYAVIAYSVNQRAMELGIRMALGASAGSLEARIVIQTLALAGVGMVVGCSVARLLSRALEGLLFGVAPTDPQTFLAMPDIVSVVACLAGYLPALRVSKLDPVAALRAN